MYKIDFTKQAIKDTVLIERAGLKSQSAKLVCLIRDNPYQNPPEYEKLQGVKSVYARRINRQHRLVYEILPNIDCLKNESGDIYEGIIKIIRLWTHYE